MTSITNEHSVAVNPEVHTFSREKPARMNFGLTEWRPAKYQDLVDLLFRIQLNQTSSPTLDSPPYDRVVARDYVVDEPTAPGSHVFAVVYGIIKWGHPDAQPIQPGSNFTPFITIIEGTNEQFVPFVHIKNNKLLE